MVANRQSRQVRRHEARTAAEAESIQASSYARVHRRQACVL